MSPLFGPLSGSCLFGWGLKYGPYSEMVYHGHIWIRRGLNISEHDGPMFLTLATVSESYTSNIPQIYLKMIVVLIEA